MIRLLLVRHGVTEWNQAGRYQGHQDVPLSNAGREQARRAAGRLRGEPITAAYSSDLQRASETAHIILDGRDVPLELAPDLREMAFGAWEGLTPNEASERYPAEWAAWIRDSTVARPPGGAEDNPELLARVTSFYHSVVQVPPAGTVQPDWFSYRAAGESSDGTSGTILLVSHGGVIRALLAYLFEMRIELYWRFGIRPASVSIFDVYPQGPIAEVIGDTSHLRNADLSAPGATDDELVARARMPNPGP
jgi:broad specificity phosphatase PhoE